MTKVEEYPTFEASDRTKKIIEKAIKDDKWIEVKDVDEYFAKLKKWNYSFRPISRRD